MNQCSQFINFQFDKFIIAAFVGLWAVAPYEVANRSAQALRSVPASAADSLLPTAVIRQSTPDSAWAWYVSSSRIAAYGVCVFMLAPLAVAPMFLYAWTGEMGYVGRWIFLGLILGAMADVLTLPAATIAQAGGQPGLQARSAALSILINVPLSLALVLNWGLVGAAIGTGIALTIGSVQLLTAVHRHVERPLSATLRMFASFWPLLLVCIFWGAVSYALFSAWFATLDPAIRFSRAIRIYPGLAAIGIYVLCVVTMGWVEWKRGAFTVAERTSLSRLMKFEWLTGTATRTKP